MNVRISNAIRQLGSTGLSGETQGDGELLRAFVLRREPAAFAALVRRHGPMVLGVCRRILRHFQDAEDAFQATFLVLARRAATVVPRERVGNWLYGVAYRTALEAKRMQARRRARETQVRDLPDAAPAVQAPAPDLQVVLDHELSRLPDKLRLPLVLCDLEGRTRREVARQLGIPDGTLSNRLAAGRRKLAKRLAARGVTLSTLALAATLTRAAEAVHPNLAASTVHAALATDSVTGAAAVSANVLILTEGVIKTMYVAKLKSLAVAFLAVILALGVGVWAGQAAVSTPPALGSTQPPIDPAAAQPQKKDLEPKAVLELAVKAATAIQATKDDDLRRKVNILTSIAIDQAKNKEHAAATATFKLALESAAAIKAELARADAQAHVGFYQANAGLIAEAQKTVDAIVVKEEKNAAEAQNHRSRVLVEMVSHLANKGQIKEAAKIAEAIPERVIKFKKKGEEKEQEYRDSMMKETALKYLVEGQLKAGEVAGALKTARTIQGNQRLWTLYDVAIALSRTDKEAAIKLVGELRKDMEAAKSPMDSKRADYTFLANLQAAIGDAEGALAWIKELKSEEDRAEALFAVSIGLQVREWKQPRKGQ
jgi:RNA polymerase sigma factor (sigma-70 family)